LDAKVRTLQTRLPDCVRKLFVPLGDEGLRVNAQITYIVYFDQFLTFFLDVSFSHKNDIFEFEAN